MRTFKLTLAYDGTAFCGWQFQVNARTVQETIQDALAKITGDAVSVVASGRTDAGVHALAQVAAFRSDTHLSADVLQRALNAELPNDISILSAEEAAADFDPIRHARRKRYRYVIEEGPVRNVFSRQYAWHSFRRLNVEAMHRAAQGLVGTHDFSSFETSGSERVTTIRTVFELSVDRCRAGQGGWPTMGQGSEPIAVPIHVEVEADGYLYNMVRTIVGTLMEVGRGARDETWPAEVLAAVDRRAAGQTAPPQGLFLMRVQYDDD